MGLPAGQGTWPPLQPGADLAHPPDGEPVLSGPHRHLYDASIEVCSLVCQKPAGIHGPLPVLAVSIPNQHQPSNLLRRYR